MTTLVVGTQPPNVGVQVVGPPGPAGPGVPAGGATGQELVKRSAADYDTQWVTPAVGGGVMPTLVTLATDGSDQTALLQNAINAAMATGGSHWIQLARSGTGLDAVILGQITFPNDGTVGQPHQAPLRITGWVGSWNQVTPPSMAPGLDMRYAGGAASAKIDTRGSGHLVLEDLMLKDTTDGTTPFFHTTLTTVHIKRCTFWGRTAAPSALQDAIILGGSNTGFDNTFQSAFAGYGSIIKDNEFQNIRVGIRGNTFTNGVVIRDNHFGQFCGGDATHSAIYIGINNGTTATSNLIEGNTVEVTNYVYGIILDHSNANILLSNGFYDQAAGTTLSSVRMINAGYNFVMHAFDGPANVFSEDAASAGSNTGLSSLQGAAWKMGSAHLDGAGSTGNRLGDLTLTNGGLTLTGATTINTGPGQDIYIGYSGGNGAMMFYGNSRNNLYIRGDGQLQTSAQNEATGTGSAGLGANCPAVTPAAPYRWEKIMTTDGSQCWFPVWK
jgi:hypothetical protein